MRKLKEFGAPLILGGLTLIIMVAAAIATYRVGKDALGLPLAILFPIGYAAALAGAFALIRKRFGRVEGSRSGQRVRGASMGKPLSSRQANSRKREVE